MFPWWESCRAGEFWGWLLAEGTRRDSSAPAPAPPRGPACSSPSTCHRCGQPSASSPLEYPAGCQLGPHFKSRVNSADLSSPSRAAAAKPRSPLSRRRPGHTLPRRAQRSFRFGGIVITQCEKGNKFFKTSFRSAVVVLALLRLPKDTRSVLLQAWERQRELWARWGGSVLRSRYPISLVFCYFRNSFPPETRLISPLFSCSAYLLLFLCGAGLHPASFPPGSFPVLKSIDDLCKHHEQRLLCDMSHASVKVLNKCITNLAFTAL